MGYNAISILAMLALLWIVIIWSRLRSGPVKGMGYYYALGLAYTGAMTGVVLLGRLDLVFPICVVCIVASWLISKCLRSYCH